MWRGLMIAGLMTTVGIGSLLAAPVVCIVPAEEGDPAFSQGAMAITEFALRDLAVAAALPRRQVEWVLSDIGVPPGDVPTSEESLDAAGRLGAEVVIFLGMAHDTGEWTATTSWTLRRTGESGDQVRTSAPELLDALRAAIDPILQGLTDDPSATADGRIVWPPTTSEEALLAFLNGCRLDGDMVTYQEAIDAFRLALDADPTFAAARKELATVLYQRGEITEAVEELRSALDERPEMAVLYANLGAMLTDLGEPDEATDALVTAIDLGTDPLATAYAHNNLGLVHRRAGDFDQALTEFERARRMLPRYSMAHCNVAWIHQRVEEYDVAIDVLERVVEFRNDQGATAYAYRLLGDIAVHQDDLRAAQPYYQTALEIRPDYAMVYNQLGYTYRKLGDIDAAKEAYALAIGLNTDATAAAYAHNSLGNIYRDEGDVEQAIAAYEAALDMKPDYDLARENLEKLMGGR